MSSSTTAAYPPAAGGSAPGVATTSAGAVVDRVEHAVARGPAHRHAGERATQLLGGAPVTEDGRAEPVAAAHGAGAAPARRRRTTGSVGGRCGRVSCSGPEQTRQRAGSRQVSQTSEVA